MEGYGVSGELTPMTVPTPHVYGTVAPEIISAVGGMQDRVKDLQQELGRIEVHKAKMITEILHLDKQARGLLNQEAVRLGIPPGTSWELNNGQALAVPSPPKLEG